MLDFALCYEFTADQTLREIALGNGYDPLYELIDIQEITKP